MAPGVASKHGSLLLTSGPRHRRPAGTRAPRDDALMDDVGALVVFAASFALLFGLAWALGRL
jgi:hypothetical protein